MTLGFTTTIEGKTIRCTIQSDTPIKAPTLCFSTMAEPVVLSGGNLVRCVASYAEVLLPDLEANVPATVVIGYANPDFWPKNRAWLPLGAYLRTEAGPLALPEGSLGVRLDSAEKPAGSFAGLNLIPQPTSWAPTTGSVALSTLQSDDPALIAVDQLALRLGLPPLLAATGPKVAVRHDTTLAAEGYRLTIASADITIAAADATGRFYAGITLLNLRETYGGAVPCGTITDAPRFGWRGQHLDCARHFFATDTIHRLFDLMALFKLNRFHWHFADDEAFRLEVDSFPALWQKTAFRGEGQLIPSVFGGGIRAGGTYSKADAAALIEHARALHIEILPEIEVPAHAFALNKAISGLRDPHDRGLGNQGSEVSIQGYRENIINPALPATWALVEPLALEVAEMFPFGMLHLGCDELPPGAWEGSPAVDALKAREGLKDRDDVQGWMMEKLAAFLKQNGFRSAAWEEAAKGAQGGIGHGALLFSWTGQGPGVAAARAGHQVVMCPAQHTYFDLAHSADPGDWGATWAGALALEATVNWKPVPAGAEDIAGMVAGVQGCFWGEFTTHDRQMEPMLAPRILGLANKGWDRADSVDGKAIRALAARYAPLFDKIGWQRNPAA